MKEDIEILEHEILGMLKRVGMTIIANGSEAEGHIPINKFLEKTAFLQFGMLTALLNDYDRYSSKRPGEPTMLNTVKLKREQIDQSKYDFGRVATAIETLEFNGDVKDVTNGSWIDINDREIHLTPKGLISYNTKFYVRESEKEKYTEQLAKSTLRTNQFIVYTFVAIAVGTVAQWVPIFKTDPLAVRSKQNEVTLHLQQEIQLLKDSITYIQSSKAKPRN